MPSLNDMMTTWVPGEDVWLLSRFNKRGFRVYAAYTFDHAKLLGSRLVPRFDPSGDHESTFFILYEQIVCWFQFHVGTARVGTILSPKWADVTSSPLQPSINVRPTALFDGLIGSSLSIGVFLVDEEVPVHDALL